MVLHVGRLAVEKNLTLALRAFREIILQRPEARFVLVGDGPERERLEREHPGLILPGAKVGAELAEHYASGDLFLFPSLSETFGNVVPEAMASGLSVIAFAYGAGGTCIRSGENGVKVPLADEDAFVAAAAALSRDDVVRPAMGKQARAATEAMSWGRVVRDLEERLFEAIRLRRERANASLGTTTQ